MVVSVSIKWNHALRALPGGEALAIKKSADAGGDYLQKLPAPDSGTYM